MFIVHLKVPETVIVQQPSSETWLDSSSLMSSLLPALIGMEMRKPNWNSGARQGVRINLYSVSTVSRSSGALPAVTVQQQIPGKAPRERCS